MGATGQDLRLAQNPVFDAFFLFRASFNTEDFHASPQLDLGLSPIHLRRNLPEIELHLYVRSSAMSGRAVNITDVPFALWSGGEEDQLLPFQQEDTVVPILPDDLAKSHGQLEIRFFHGAPPPVFSNDDTIPGASRRRTG